MLLLPKITVLFFTKHKNKIFVLLKNSYIFLKFNKILLKILFRISIKQSLNEIQIKIL